MHVLCETSAIESKISNTETEIENETKKKKNNKCVSADDDKENKYQFTS